MYHSPQNITENQKRKSDELITEDDLQECQDPNRSKYQIADSGEQATTSDYKKRMRSLKKIELKRVRR